MTWVPTQFSWFFWWFGRVRGGGGWAAEEWNIVVVARGLVAGLCDERVLAIGRIDIFHALIFAVCFCSSQFKFPR